MSSPTVNSAPKRSLEEIRRGQALEVSGKLIQNSSEYKTKTVAESKLERLAELYLTYRETDGMGDALKEARELRRATKEEIALGTEDLASAGETAFNLLNTDLRNLVNSNLSSYILSAGKHFDSAIQFADLGIARIQKAIPAQIG